jgi:hypothetical protein
VRVTLVDGRSVRCTPEHRFAVAADNADLVWTSASALRAGADRAVCGAVLPCMHDDEPVHDAHAVRARALARLIGAALACAAPCEHDGGDDDNDAIVHVRSAVDLRSVLSDCAVVDAHFDASAATSRSSSDGSWRVRVPCVVRAELLACALASQCVSRRRAARRAACTAEWPAAVAARSWTRRECAAALIGVSCAMRLSANGDDATLAVGVPTWLDALQRALKALGVTAHVGDGSRLVLRSREGMQ